MKREESGTGKIIAKLIHCRSPWGQGPFVKNRRRVARALNISHRALLYKIRDTGLDSNRGGEHVLAASRAAELDGGMKAA
jgi:hypothetical protein